MHSNPGVLQDPEKDEELRYILYAYFDGYLCIKLASPWHPDIWSNIILGGSIKVPFR